MVHATRAPFRAHGAVRGPGLAAPNTCSKPGPVPEHPFEDSARDQGPSSRVRGHIMTTSSDHPRLSLRGAPRCGPHRAFSGRSGIRTANHRGSACIHIVYLVWWEGGCGVRRAFRLTRRRWGHNMTWMKPSHVFWLAALVALLAHALATADNPLHLVVGFVAMICIFLAFSALLEFIDRAWANRRNPR